MIESVKRSKGRASLRLRKNKTHGLYPRGLCEHSVNIEHIHTTHIARLQANPPKNKIKNTADKNYKLTGKTTQNHKQKKRTNPSPPKKTRRQNNQHKQHQQSEQASLEHQHESTLLYSCCKREKTGHLHELQQRPRLRGLRLLHVQTPRHWVVGRDDQLEGSRGLLACHDGNKAIAANGHALQRGGGGGGVISISVSVKNRF